ncbi:hypothetical protein HDU97_008436 [Phlyctochytrium planicorne]|nr:hypothetical protein HDU97_008436 [Phlyctochytrium planicorne]
MPVIFALRLGDDGSTDDRTKYTRIPPPVPNRPFWLRFIITAGSKASFDSHLVTNYPEDGLDHDDLRDAVCDIPITQPGVFEYYVEYKSVNSTKDSGYIKSKNSGSLVVDPRLYLPNRAVLEDGTVPNTDILLPLDGICILTVIPKWMPTINRWPDYFKSFNDGGYNMLHFAPLNTRGSSNSPYSIFDQLSISGDLFDGNPSEDEREKVLGETLERARFEFSLLSITDVVWNHTACNSEWLQHHPEAGYNLKNSPHLRIAYEIDEALMHMSDDLEAAGVSNVINSEDTLQAAMKVLHEKVIPKLRLWEFYVIDVKATEKEFKEAWLNRRKGPLTTPAHKLFASTNLTVIKDRGDVLRREAVEAKVPGARFGKALNMDICIAFLEMLLNSYGSSAPGSVEDQFKLFMDTVNELNLPFYQECDGDVAVICENVTNRSRYLRVDGHGPKLGPVTKSDPIVDTYFTRIPHTEATKNRHQDELYVANNGWIWNADPLMNFAGPGSKAYLRREVIAWGDCVKLRYGSGPEDNPWLWSHQKAYTEKMARLFHGFRIDNCHSTPIHVAAYLLDAARRIRPDLYVFAELFTGSEEKDITFVSKLGIHSLIREAMNAWDPRELSRPVAENENLVIEVRGSSPHALFMDCTHDNETPHQKRTAEDTLPTAALVAMSNCAVGSVKGFDELVPELLNVVTETRKYRLADSYEGIIPAKSVLLHLHTKMAREGYNEIHVHQEHDFISVHRVHPVTHDGYLLIARSAFSHSPPSEHLHSPIVLKNQSVHILQSAGLRVQVQTPSHNSLPYIHHSEEEEHDLSVPVTPTQHSMMGFHADADAIRKSRDKRSSIGGRKTLGVITGLPCYLDYSNALTTLMHAKVENGNTELRVEGAHFLPGSVVVYRTWMNGSGMDVEALEEDSEVASDGLTISFDFERSKKVREVKGRERSLTVDVEEEGNIERLWRFVGMAKRNVGIETMMVMGRDILESAEVWGGNWALGLWDAVKVLGEEECNVALYRCGAEEIDGIGEGVYDVPGFGSIPFCGLQGFASVIHPVARNNDLGHPICDNLRAGHWMLDYVVSRLEKYSTTYPSLTPLKNWLSVRFKLMKSLPASFTPKYFFTIILMAFRALRFHVISQTPTSSFIRPETTGAVSSLKTFAQGLGISTYQFYGRVKSTGLRPPVEGVKREACLAAGLPHFATAHMRCWGRDIFISLRGLLLVPGHFQAAREHLIAFGATVKHGLIPNLLDQGVYPRYNARDAAWWWLWGVQEYCRVSEEGLGFLSVEVKRRFKPLKRYTRGPDYLKVGEEADGDAVDVFCEVAEIGDWVNTIGQLCHEILERHARGVRFREWNAGTRLDHAMVDKGFEVAVGTRFGDGSGIVGGGNRFNCGTWMDKMGDSERAGSKGVPATPRDGADVEIVGLCKATLRWIVADVLTSDVGKKAWPATGVVIRENDSEKTIAYSQWNDMLGKNFEKFFYIPKDPREEGGYAIDRPELVNRRGIYKDTVGASQAFADYQLRPNFLVALVVAPEMINADHARGALELTKDVLLGPLGMKTLDPSDWSYRGYYDNSNDSSDPSVAHGFNYHQGPEWVWLMGYFLRAYLYYNIKAPGSDPNNKRAVIHFVQSVIMKHKIHMADVGKNPFAGLPELTNANGEFCGGSCPTQAWSNATLLEVVSDLYELKK